MKRIFFQKDRYKTKSVLVKWAASYLAILLLPNLIFLYSYRVTVKTIQDEIRHANELVLSNLKDSIDRQLEFAKKASAYTYSIRQFANIRLSPVLDSAFRYEVAQMRQVLSAYAFNSNSELKTTVYFRDLDYIVSNQTANISEALYGSQSLRGMSGSYADWIHVLSADYYDEFILSNQLQIGSTADCIVYANSLRHSGLNINVFISIPLSTILAYTEGLSGRSLIITDQDGKPVLRFGDMADIDVLDLTSPSGSLTEGSNGVQYVALYEPSAETDWYYSIISSEDSFFQTSVRLNGLFVASLICSIVIGSTLIWLLLERNYKPVDRLLESTERMDIPGDEFERIKYSFNRLASENQSMQSTLTQQTEQLRERYLLMRLKGRSSYLDHKDTDSFYEIANKDDRLLLIGFSAGSMTATKHGYYRDEYEYTNINLFAVNNVFMELMNDFSFYKIEDGQHLFYLVVISQGQAERWSEQGFGIISRICNVFIEKLSIPLTAAISDLTANMNDLSLLYSDVMDAIEYKSMIGEHGCILTGELELADPLVEKNAKWSKVLSETVEAGDKDAAKQIVGKVFNEYKKNITLPFTVFRIYIISLMNSALSSYYEVVLDSNQSNKLLMPMLENLTSSEDIPTLYESFLDLLAFMCEMTSKQQSRSENHFVEKIEDYVLENFQDKLLNISTIAEAMKRNPRTISRLFKIQTGNGLLDYINYVRIQKAKEIMTSETITIEELAERVGYSNDRTFRRAFIREEGVTPGKYIQQL